MDLKPGSVNYAQTAPLLALDNSANPPVREMSLREMLLRAFPDETIKNGQRLRIQQVRMLNAMIAQAKRDA